MMESICEENSVQRVSNTFTYISHDGNSKFGGVWSTIQEMQIQLLHISLKIHWNKKHFSEFYSYNQLIDFLL